MAPALPPVLPFAGHASDDDDDDDEDDDSDFVPPFNLLQSLTRVGTSAELVGKSFSVEAIHFRDDRVLAIHHVQPGERLVVAGLTVAHRDVGGLFLLDARLTPNATVRQEGRRMPPEETEIRGVNGLPLEAGMQAVIQLAHDDSVLVQIVPQAAALAPVKHEIRPMLERLKPGAASVGVHLLLLVIFGITLLRGTNAVADDVNEGRFATINLQPVEIEPPPPKELPPSVEKAVSKNPHARVESRAFRGKDERQGVRPTRGAQREAHGRERVRLEHPQGARGRSGLRHTRHLRAQHGRDASRSQRLPRLRRGGQGAG